MPSVGRICSPNVDFRPGCRRSTLRHCKRKAVFNSSSCHEADRRRQCPTAVMGTAPADTGGLATRHDTNVLFRQLPLDPVHRGCNIVPV